MTRSNLRLHMQQRANESPDERMARLMESGPRGPWEARMAELIRAGVDQFTARRQALAESDAGTAPLREVAPSSGQRVVQLVESVRSQPQQTAVDAAAVQALPSQARTLFEQWREVGRTDAEALEEVRRSGLIEQENLEESFLGLGLSPEAAKLAARGRDGGVRPVDPFDAMVEMFERHGLSPEAARTAAIGHGGSESEVRADMREAAALAEGQDAFAEAARTVADRFGWDAPRAIQHLKDKIRSEWADLSLEAGAAQLRAYADQLGR